MDDKCIMEGPYVEKTITIPRDPNAILQREETRRLHTKAEMTVEEMNYYEADGLAIQQILMGLPNTIFANVDS